MRPRDVAGKTRRRIAADELADLVVVEAKKATPELQVLVRARDSRLMDLPGVGPVVAARTLADEGVVAGPTANGAHVLHLSVAFCILNDTYREAARLGIEIYGVAVEADGAFDGAWHSTGIDYSVTLDAGASIQDLERLRAVVDEVAEIPRAIRAGASVTRRDELRLRGDAGSSPRRKV